MYFLSALLFVILCAADGTEYDSNIPRFVSESNNATLRFTSDEVMYRRGVVLSYTIGKFIDDYLNCREFKYKFTEKISRVE